jgi:transposase
MTGKYELTAAQWRKIEMLLPGKKGDRGRTAADNRKFVNGVLWVLRSGAHWKHMPAEYGNWKSAHKRFTRWTQAGIWEKVFAVAAADPSNRYVLLDSTTVRAHQQAAAGKGGTKAKRWGAGEAD